MLDLVRARLWQDGEFVTVEPEELDGDDRETFVWVELRVAEDEEWYSKRLKPWENDPRPVIEPARIEGLDLPADFAYPAGEVLIDVLGNLYELGLPRITRELLRGDHLEGDTRFFPTLGFEPADGWFWTVRINVAVVGNRLFTLRLPDDHCAPKSAAPKSKPDPEIDFPERFLPYNKDVPTAEEVANSLALYQAATARAIAEHAHLALSRVEQRAFNHLSKTASGGSDANGEGPERDAQLALKLLSEFRTVSEVVHGVDDELSRLLRRLGSHYAHRSAVQTPDARPGNGAAAAVGLRNGTGREIVIRYHYALDEIRSLETDLRLASEVMTGMFSTRQLEISKEQAKTAMSQQETAHNQQEQAHRFQRGASVLAAAVTGAAVVAGAYGASLDEGIPGPNDERGFVAMLLFMVAFAAVTLLGIQTIVLHEGPASPLRRWAGERWVFLCGCICVVAAVGGVLLAMS